MRWLIAVMLGLLLVLGSVASASANHDFLCEVVRVLTCVHPTPPTPRATPSPTPRPTPRATPRATPLPVPSASPRLSASPAPLPDTAIGP